RLNLLESLGVGDHFRGVERAAYVVDQRRWRGRAHRAVGTGQRLGGELAVGLERGKESSKDRLRDGGHWDPQVERRLRGPFAGTFLRRLVEDDVDQRATGGAVALGQHFG